MRKILAALAVLAPAAALAHVGTDAGSHHGFTDGLTHPFTGLDHLAAMIAVGVWSALAFANTDRRTLLAPLSFATMLLAGALLGIAGLAMPAIEPMIAASLLVIGLLVAARAKMPASVMSLIVGAFAVFHGAAHGYELAGTNATAAILGMLLGTVILHGIGIALGSAMRNHSAWLPRAAGAGVAVFGASLLAGMV